MTARLGSYKRWRRCAIRVTGWTFAVGIGLSDARAHDYWLEPGSPLASRGEELVVHLELGERLKTEEERPLQKDRMSRFDLFSDRAAKRDLLAAGQEGQIPVAKTRLESGAALMVMDRKPRPITLEAEKFNQYLADEGLDVIIAQRTRSGQTGTNGREVYNRCLKMLIQERDPGASTVNTLYKRRVGQRLEILLENDPGRLKPDGELAVKVLFEDKPLAGVRIFACHRAGENQPVEVVPATTSAKGLAEFKLDQAGLWLVRLVHMRATAAGGKGETQPQWESFWGAYTFAARFAPVPAQTPGASPSAPPPTKEAPVR